MLLAAAAPLMEQLFPQVPLIEQVHRTPMLIFGVLELCLAAAFLALWRAARDYRVFRTLGFFYAIVGVEQFLQYFAGFIPLEWSLRAIAVAVLVEAAGDAMQVTRRGWTRLFWPVYVFAGIATWFPFMDWVNDLPAVFSEVALGILIVLGFRGGNRRDRMVAGAFAFHFFVRLTISNSFQRLTGLKNYASIGGWQWQYTTIGITALGTVTLVILARDLLRDRSEKQRLAAELAASRAVQQMLIPRETPTIPGFKIESVYRPFGDVGGDFFQILPLSENGALVVIGDVSGKGMPAALTVSLAVGALSLAIESSTRPGEILASLNRALMGRNCDGFTTCLVLCAESDGSLTFANAGHIAPYLAGKELTLENGLPLGLAADATYTESAFQLAPNQQLTLLTDGVIEARDKSGALYGFERTAAISGESADQIAKTAELFGQDDDITVLTVLRTA
jgi:hypothetical protein